MPEELSAEEARVGVRIARVEETVGGARRLVPQKIMPDPDDPGRQVVCRRDPETGQYVPVRRRGALLVVERGGDDVWRLVEGAGATAGDQGADAFAGQEAPEGVGAATERDAAEGTKLSTDEGMRRIQAEVAALPAEAPAAEPGAVHPVSYDFKHPARVNRDQFRALENLHDNFARLMSSTFSGAMRAVVDVDTAFVDQTTYAEFIMSLTNPGCAYQFTLGPTGGQAIIDFAPSVHFAFVDRILGGKGSGEGVQPRQVTPIEIGIINRILKRVIEDLEATWEPILRVEITDIELETNPEFMQIAAANDIVILLAFEVNSTHAKGLISLCYPFFTLDSVLPLLGRQDVRPRGRLLEEAVRRSRAALGPVRVPVTAELGRAEISLGQARALRPGDVICSRTRCQEPCIVTAAGEPKYYARPFRGADGQLRLQVTGRVPRALQPDLK